MRLFQNIHDERMFAQIAYSWKKTCLILNEHNTVILSSVPVDLILLNGSWKEIKKTKRQIAMEWWAQRSELEQKLLKKLYRKGATGREIEQIYDAEHPAVD